MEELMTGDLNNPLNGIRILDTIGSMIGSSDAGGSRHVMVSSAHVLVLVDVVRAHITYDPMLINS
jgi:hypothetical protein